MPKQMVWYVGFMLGAVATALLLGLFGVGGILRFILVIGGGIGCGALADHLASREP